MFSAEEKNLILSSFVELLKDANGKGPKNIHIKYFEKEIQIIIHGVISDFEKYLIGNFGQEAIDTFEDFYQRDCKNAEKKFNEILGDEISLSFKHLESDFRKDIFTYIMSYSKIIK